MDPEEFTTTTNLFKWDPRGVPLVNHLVVDPPFAAPPPVASLPVRPPACRELGGLDSLFQAYGIRYLTAAKIRELGFTVNTLLNMREEEIDDMMNSLSHIFHWELLVGEKYGIKAAVRAERRRLLEDEEAQRHGSSGGGGFHSVDTANYVLDALSQEGLSEEPVQQVVQGRGEAGTWELAATTMAVDQRKKHRRRKAVEADFEGENDQDDEERRQREHPFIVTEPGEVARGKKNGLDYLFHLYEQCREFLVQVQNAAKERGEKCPTKVTNQVFRYAKKVGASYINKPKMRHYVHCYALHCLDEEASNTLRRELKERGENVGAWRQACYKPLVGIAAAQGWDMDAIFNGHPRLSIWYVPTKLRQLCHAASTSTVVGAAAVSSSATASTSSRSSHYILKLP
ncbi:hypothetical protein MLD38_026531 [Melastoma candidum]|uniref:Uncharacterized protein n=1 Tax=Melastoma candidum TaxID=119954 RepID=A0ACB9NZX9_9MYRT|nr:hypothetical protein MLD38_026531 [Melastoma candidum]